MRLTITALLAMCAGCASDTKIDAVMARLSALDDIQSVQADARLDLADIGGKIDKLLSVAPIPDGPIELQSEAVKDAIDGFGAWWSTERDKWAGIDALNALSKRVDALEAENGTLREKLEAVVSCECKKRRSSQVEGAEEKPLVVMWCPDECRPGCSQCSRCEALQAEFAARSDLPFRVEARWRPFPPEWKTVLRQGWCYPIFECDGHLQVTLHCGPTVDVDATVDRLLEWFGSLAGGAYGKRAGVPQTAGEMLACHRSRCRERCRSRVRDGVSRTMYRLKS